MTKPVFGTALKLASLATSIMLVACGGGGSDGPPPPPEEFLLSAKERAVLSGIQEGCSYKEIAASLNISPHTVHSHIKHIYEKLQASDKRDALTKARRKGLL